MAGRNRIPGRVNTVKEDEYFPCYLTEFPSSSGKEDDNGSPSSSGLDRFDSNWKSKTKPRLTFAESLSMARRLHEEELEKDSPFRIGGLKPSDGNYMDRIYTRKRQKKLNDSVLSEDSETDEDTPPPPTNSLLTSNLIKDLSELEPLRPSRATGASASLNLHETSYPPSSSFEEPDAWSFNREYWVTIYGFPVGEKPSLVAIFERLGDVIQRDITSLGNYFHLRYATLVQAEQVLALDGTIIKPNVMVGVKKLATTDLMKKPEDMPRTRRTNVAIGSKEVQVDPFEDEILLPPRPRPNICTRLFQYLFST